MISIEDYCQSLEDEYKLEELLLELDLRVAREVIRNWRGYTERTEQPQSGAVEGISDTAD